MTRTFSAGHPKVLPACNFLSQYYFYNIFLQKSCRFSLQTLTKFEATKTGSGVGFLRLTAVWGSRPLAITSGQFQYRKSAIHGLPVTLRMPRVESDKSDWFWSQSIVFTKPFKTRMSLDLARGPDFQRMTKGTPGDEVACTHSQSLACGTVLEDLNVIQINLMSWGKRLSATVL